MRAKGKAPQLLNLEIVVQNQLLPYPKDWKYRLDLWQNPWAVAWYITWVIFPITAAVQGLVKAILDLKEGK